MFDIAVLRNSGADRAARARSLILHRDSGGGGPREAWWRGRLTRRFVVVAGETTRPAPLPPRKRHSRRFASAYFAQRTVAEGRLCPLPAIAGRESCTHSNPKNLQNSATSARGARKLLAG